MSDDGDAAPGARWAPDPAGPTDRPLDWLLDTSAADARNDGTPPGSSHQDGADQDGADQDGADQDGTDQDGADQDGAFTDGPRPDGAEPDDAS